MEIIKSNGRRFVLGFALCLITLFGICFLPLALGRNVTNLPVISARDLPIEARKTLELIKQGGPFPYVKDGAVFGNYEKVLPRQKRGYYREFTVRTPGARNRGASRIIAGGDPVSSGEYYYTDDHYVTFSRIKE